MNGSLHRPLRLLIGEADIERFLAEDFGKRVVVWHRPNAAEFAKILSLPAYYHVIAALPASTTKFRHRPSLAHRLNLAGEDGYINMDAVLAGYAQGSTAYLDEGERLHPPLHDFCEALWSDLRARGVTLAERGPATVFLTPPNSQALEPHTDPMDLFVLQIEGEKHWRFFGDAPQSGPHGVTVNGLPECTKEAVLRPGSVAYIPRGYAHVARTEGTHSFAVTIGFYPLTWAQLVADAVKAHLAETPEHYHVVGASELDGRKLSAAGLMQLLAILHRIAAPSNLENLASAVRVDDSGKEFSGFEQINVINQLASGTVLRARDTLKHTISEKKAFLSSGARYISGASEVFGGIFETLVALGNRSICVGELGSYTDEVKIGLAKRLVVEGLFEIVKSSARQ